MEIKEIKMDLFDVPKDYTLVHCISQDCAMGKGIAKTFDNKYPGMKSYLYNLIRDEDLHFPIAIGYRGDENQHDVINMITKAKYWHKPTYTNFTVALKNTATLCKEYNIKKLAMPKIGCGLDRLNWSKVKSIIENCFKDLDIEIIICYL